MAKLNLTGPTSSITRKATTMTARSLATVQTNLENKIRKLLRAKKLTAKQKEELAGLKNQLKDVKAEMKAEASAAGRSLDQAAANKKKFKGYDPSKDSMAEKERVEPRLSDMTKEEIAAKLKAEDEAAAAARKKARGRAKGGVMGFNMGGMPSRKGSYDYRKGGMFK
jgi:hypothetical protein